MKTIIIYSSQTGFTKKYAQWIAEELNAQIITLKEAKKKGDSFLQSFDAIVYGGWNMANSIVDSSWIMEKATSLKEKKMALYCVGASPYGDANVEKMISGIVPENLSTSVKAFYCPGGLDYSKMNLPSKMILKAMSSSLRKKKDATKEERAMGELLSKSFDNSDKKYAMEIVNFING